MCLNCHIIDVAVIIQILDKEIRDKDTVVNLIIWTLSGHCLDLRIENPPQWCSG